MLAEAKMPVGRVNRRNGEVLPALWLTTAACRRRCHQGTCPSGRFRLSRHCGQPVSFCVVLGGSGHLNATSAISGQGEAAHTVDADA